MAVAALVLASVALARQPGSSPEQAAALRQEQALLTQQEQTIAAQQRLLARQAALVSKEQDELADNQEELSALDARVDALSHTSDEDTSPDESATGTVDQTTAANPSQAAEKWFAVDADAHSATLTLIAAYNGSDSGFNFDGYGEGEMTVTVPEGYRLTIRFSNRADLPHSVVITAVANRYIENAPKPVFPGANTPNPAEGVTSGVNQSFTFTASKVGTYLIACGVFGHAEDGFWDTLQIVKGGAASIHIGPPPTLRSP